ncbi:MAG: ABC-ATPase domain-containing protein [Acidiferrobacterales bacterium]
MDRLKKRLNLLQKKSYKAYKELKGEYDFGLFQLSIDHVQGDPFAQPSRISLHISHTNCGMPAHLWSSAVRQAACEDFLARCLRGAIDQHVSTSRGSGHSDEVAISANGQQVLKRNCVLITPNGIEARITVGLPADGRRILADDATRILIEELPQVVRTALVYRNLPASEFMAHVDCIEDQSSLRDSLSELGLIAFLADGSLLPRRSGIDDRPMASGVIPLRAPDSLAVEVNLPHRGYLRGLGIKKGITLIVGGGFHGKSTLLRALERGVYDHVPGDGREASVTDASAVKVRSEDGRNISRLDISAFINNLPLGRSTTDFSTDNASGSTSQAANIIEALQSGSRALFIDEDTSATNFMIRDQRMQKLVADEKEPITPFLHRVRELYEDYDVSSVIVMGGSGDYLSISDTVVMMDNYEIRDVTQQAKSLGNGPHLSQPLSPVSVSSPRHPASVDWRRSGKTKIAARGINEIVFGNQKIDISKLEQLVDTGQAEAIGWIVKYYANNILPENMSLLAGMEEISRIINEKGLDVFTPYDHMGNFAAPRVQELLATINRMRDLDWIIQE